MMSTASSIFTIARLRWQRRFAHSGWAFQLGAALMVAGVLSLGLAQYFSRSATRLGIAGELAMQNKPSQPRLSPNFLPETGLPTVPAYSTQLDDVSALFKLATSQGIELGPIDYRTETGTGSFVVRSADLRIEGSYVKLKALIASMLRYLPHLYIREIQVEQTNATASNVRFLVKLSLVYRKPDGSGVEGSR